LRVLYFEVHFYNNNDNDYDYDGVIIWSSVKWIDNYDGSINTRGFWGYAIPKFDDKKGEYVKEITWLDPLKYDGSIKQANIILRKLKLLKINNE
jgi:hypothetical protein